MSDTERKTLNNAIRLDGLISDINPTEICSQIESDNLSNWCKTIQTEMRMAMTWEPSTQPNQQWIPCSKRLPEKIEKNYWVCTDFGYQCPCKWRKYPSKRGDFWTWHLNAHVVAWMPLPKPYEESENG